MPGKPRRRGATAIPGPEGSTGLASYTAMDRRRDQRYRVGGMRSFGRRFSAILAALAVFMVGATCTQAGCVLPAQLSGVAGASVPACCQGHAKHPTPTGSHDTPTKSCPACQQTLFSSATIAKSVGHLPLAVASVQFLAADYHDGWHVQSFASAFMHPSEGPPGHAPPTLFALRCAFLI